MSAKPEKPLPSPKALTRYLLCHLREGVTTLGDLWRSPISSMMTIAVVGIALTLPLMFLILLSHGEKLVHSLNGQSQISLLLKASATQPQRTQLVENLKSRPEISDIQIISPSDALKELDLALNIQNTMEMLSENLLPWSLVLTLQVTEAEQVETLLGVLARLPEVEMASLDLQWVKRLVAAIAAAEQWVIALAVLLSVAALLVIGNTLRINIENRREHIEVAKLLGATNAFVRRPFLYFGMWYGGLGALLALMICLVFVQWMSRSMSQLFALYDSPITLHGLDLVSALWVLALGTLLGFGAAWLSVSHHLRQLKSW